MRWWRIGLGTLWALVLALAGVHLLWEGPGHWGVALLAIGAPDWSVRLLGAGAALAGHFVFGVLVADELFPRAHPRLVVWSQALTLAAFTMALVLSLLALSAG